MRDDHEMEKLTISFLEKSNIEEAARVLSLAMIHNPNSIALFQGHGETERKEMEKDFLASLSDLPGSIFSGRMDGQIVGVMRMLSCDGHKVANTPVGTDDREGIRERKSVWYEEWARHDPPDPHWHLGPIAVLPACQGKGIGTKLMHRFCQEVDACSAAAYLETDMAQIVPFYERFGFEVRAESDIFGVKNSYMWRSPVKKG